MGAFDFTMSTEATLGKRLRCAGRTIETTTLCFARYPMAHATSPSVRSDRNFARGVPGVKMPGCPQSRSLCHVQRMLVSLEEMEASRLLDANLLRMFPSSPC
jgi:hypothetical protein